MAIPFQNHGGLGRSGSGCRSRSIRVGVGAGVGVVHVPWPYRVLHRKPSVTALSLRVRLGSRKPFE
eukprot:2748771-Pyramimonas_sp.AAC.1